MSTYRKLDMHTWNDDKFLALSDPNPSGKHLWLYLLTGRQTTSIPGVVPHAPRAVCAALGWSWTDQVKLAGEDVFEELTRAGLARVDHRAGLIWLPNALRYNEPLNPNQVNHWGRTWKAQVPQCELEREAFQLFTAYMEGRGRSFAEAFAKPFAKSSNPMVPGISPALSTHSDAAMIEELSQLQVSGIRKESSDTIAAIITPTPPAGASDPGFAGSPSSDPFDDDPFGAPDPEDLADLEGFKLAPPPTQRVKKPPSGPHQEFMEGFGALFRAHHGVDPEWGDKQHGQVKRLLGKPGGLPDALQRAGRMFRAAPRWPAEKPHLGALVAFWDVFASDPSAATGGYVAREGVEYPEGEIDL